MNTRLIELRESRGLSQEMLAQEIGISQQVISKIERDGSKMTRSHMELFADYFDVSADYLLGRTLDCRALMEADIVVKSPGKSLNMLQKYERLGAYNRKILESIADTLFKLEHQ